MIFSFLRFQSGHLPNRLCPASRPVICRFMTGQMLPVFQFRSFQQSRFDDLSKHDKCAPFWSAFSFPGQPRTSPEPPTYLPDKEHSIGFFRCIFIRDSYKRYYFHYISMSTVFFYNKYTATVLIQAVLRHPCMALTGQADILLPYSTASFAERHRHIAELPPVFVFILCMHSPNVISFSTSSP